MKDRAGSLRTAPFTGFARRIGRLSGSTLCWLLVLIIGLDLALMAIRPLQYVQRLAFMPLEQNPFFYKAPELLSGDASSRVLLLGSSLPMTAVACADSSVYGGVDCNDLRQVSRYTKARCLERILREQGHGKLAVFNATAVGCMASDAFFIVSRSIEQGKRPKAVLYGIAPRDFMDNLVPDVGKTPVYQVLKDWTALGALAMRGVSPLTVAQTAAESLWYFYKVKTDYRAVLSGLASNLFGRPENLYYAALSAHKALPGGTPEPEQSGASPRAGKRRCGSGGETLTTPASDLSRLSAFELDLIEYRRRYQPPNGRRFAQELAYFEKLLELCRDSGIPLVVFNMPITQENKALIVPDLLGLYRAKVLTAPERYGAVFIDLDDPRLFVREDFLDSVHSNTQGGLKVHARLKAELALRPRLRFSSPGRTGN